MLPAIVWVICVESVQTKLNSEHAENSGQLLNGRQSLDLWDALLAKNYNQTLKELKSLFSERKAMALACKLEKYMMQLVQIMHTVMELMAEYRKANTKKVRIWKFK